MAFATAVDFATYLNRDLLDGEAGQVDMLLAAATGAIQRYCRQTIELVEDHEVNLKGNWTTRLHLPERPVVAVSSVSIDGVTYAADVDWSFDGQSTIYRGRTPFLPTGDGLDPTLHWGGPDTTIVVVYTHGFDPIPTELVALCCAMAARGAVNPAGVRQESVGSYQVTYDRTAATHLTADEKAFLRDAGYRRRHQ
jgi:hypothetical protein